MQAIGRIDGLRKTSHAAWGGMNGGITAIWRKCNQGSVLEGKTRGRDRAARATEAGDFPLWMMRLMSDYFPSLRFVPRLLIFDRSFFPFDFLFSSLFLSFFFFFFWGLTFGSWWLRGQGSPLVLWERVRQRGCSRARWSNRKKRER